MSAVALPLRRLVFGLSLAASTAAGLALLDGPRREWWSVVVLLASLALVVGSGLATRSALGGAARGRAADGLTGLITRDQFVTLLDRRLGTGASMVAIFDVEGFRQINATLGRAGGDRVLGVVAERLVGATRDTDVVARAGIDQFAVLLAGIDDDTLAAEIAGRLLASLSRPLDVAGVEIEIAASVGMTAAAGITGLDALAQATVALEAAKARSTTVEVFRPEHEASSPAALGVVGQVQRGLQDGHFEPYFQPVVDTASGKTIGFESLVRWNHPERGVIPPALFLHHIENLAVGRAFTDHLLDRSLSGLAALGVADVGLSFNLSVRDVEDRNFPMVVGALLDRHSVAARHITLEIPGRLGYRRRHTVELVLQQLGDLGCGIALDDFGSAAIPIELLALLPVTEIKIDARFVAAVREGAAARKVVQHCVGLGHGAGLRVTAKGVEREAVFEQVRELGCDAAQGFHFARAMPMLEAGAWLANERVFVSSPVDRPVPRLDR